MDTTEINALLEQYDAYIVALSCKKVNSSGTPLDNFTSDADELAQRVRIKIWHALEKNSIANYKMYIRQVVQHEFIDMVRSRKSILPLPLDQEGEFLPNVKLNALMSASEREPSIFLTQKETFSEHLARIVQTIVAFPSHQRKVMVCLLRDEVDDLRQLYTVFRQQRFLVEKIEWPEEQLERRKLKASLTHARRKLLPLQKEFLRENVVDLA